MTSSSLQHHLDHYNKQIDKTLNSLIPENSTLPEKILYSAARYSLLAPGKRLRPILTLTITELLGGTLEAALIPACTIEMIHCYSMIHDDLPCMDDDDFRRGRPTLHKVHNEAVAVLAGDYLLTHAFLHLAKAPHLTDKQRTSLITCLGTHAGGEGMIGGQILDIEATKQTPTASELKQIHEKKTAALLTASLLFGGIIAQADQDTCENLTQFGQSLGLAFQIRDDLLDVTASVEKHGNSVSSDLQQGKTTYYTLYGEKGTKKELDHHLQQAFHYLDELPHDSSPLKNLLLPFFSI